MNRGPQVTDARRRSPQDPARVVARRRRRYLNRMYWLLAKRRPRTAPVGGLVMLDGYLVHVARNGQGVGS